MAERLGLAVIPGIGWRASEIQAIAREAEEAGFDAIFAAEVNNDVMATAQLMGAATRRIQVGTWIANIYVRHSYACAQGAALIADATDGRFVLGLGVSHPPVNTALGIDMGDAPSALRRYVTAVELAQGRRPGDPSPSKAHRATGSALRRSGDVAHRRACERARRWDHAVSLVGRPRQEEQSVDRTRPGERVGTRHG